MSFGLVLFLPAGTFNYWQDGTVLRINVFRDGETPRPVILSIHPYGKDNLPTARQEVDVLPAVPHVAPARTR